MRRDTLPNADAWDRAFAEPTSATCTSIRTSPELEIVEVPERPVPGRRGRRSGRAAVADESSMRTVAALASSGLHGEALIGHRQTVATPCRRLRTARQGCRVGRFLMVTKVAWQPSARRTSAICNAVPGRVVDLSGIRARRHSCGPESSQFRDKMGGTLHVRKAFRSLRSTAPCGSW